jgi:trehalose synthase
LVEPNNKEQFGERIVEILKNPSLAREMGTKGKETVRKKFLITRLLSDYLELLSDIVN